MNYENHCFIARAIFMVETEKTHDEKIKAVKNAMLKS